MDERRLQELIRKMDGIAAAREPVDEIFAALRRFEDHARPYNRHLTQPSPTAVGWADIYARLDPEAGELGRALATHREAFSRSLTPVLDGVAGLIDEAATHGVDISDLLRQFSVQVALRRIDRVPSKLNVFLYSWGRASLAEYHGPGMRRAIEQAGGIVREASYFANYFDRMLHRGRVGERGE